ncbi:MAG: hypothetical protein WCC81_14670 [Pseudolabrys sp.]
MAMTWSFGTEAASSCDFLTTRNRKRYRSMTSIEQKKRAERLFKWKQECVKAASDYEVKEQATRLLTAKLRTERLEREAMSGKRDQKKSAKEQTETENHRLAVIAAGRWRHILSREIKHCLSPDFPDFRAIYSVRPGLW